MHNVVQMDPTPEMEVVRTSSGRHLESHFRCKIQMDQPNFADSVPTSNLITLISGTRESGRTTCSKDRASTTSPQATTTSPCGIRDRQMRLNEQTKPIV